MSGRRAEELRRRGRCRHAAVPNKRRRFTLRRVVWAFIGITAFVVTSCVVVATGVFTDDHAAPVAKQPTGPSTVSAAPPVTTSAVQSSPNSSPTMLDADFAQLRQRVHGVVGIAISAVGAHQNPTVLGDWPPGPAWSTIKVPLAIAVLREANPPEVTQTMTAAITESDNAAAESLWASLGDPTVAAQKVEKVLREADDQTEVQSQRVRPPFTAFGQTIWSLTEQAKFISFAVCDSPDQSIFTLMGQIEKNQRWGLGNIAEARFKGGWGPKTTGEYLVRQIGVMPTPGGMTAVAVAVEPASGSLDDGTEALTDVASWLFDHREALPSGQCRR
jgi:hypothetical protein